MRNEYQERCLAEAKKMLEDIRDNPTCLSLELFHRCLDKADASIGNVGIDAKELMDLHQRAIAKVIRSVAGHPDGMEVKRSTVLGSMRRQFVLIRDHVVLATSQTLTAFILTMRELRAGYEDFGTDERTFQIVARPALLAEMRAQLAMARRIRDIEALMELRTAAVLNDVSFEEIGISEEEFHDIFMDSLKRKPQSDQLN